MKITNFTIKRNLQLCSGVFFWFLFFLTQLASGQNCSREVLTEGSRPFKYYEIKLPPTLELETSQISGMTKIRSKIVLLQEDSPIIYRIDQNAIDDCLKDSESSVGSGPIATSTITIEENSQILGDLELRDFEAIATKPLDNSHELIYLLIEKTDTHNVLLKGIFEINSETITVSKKTEFSTMGIHNKGFETLLAIEEGVIAIPEINGFYKRRNYKDRAIVKKFDDDINEIGFSGKVHLNHRVADATRLDQNNNFWVINETSHGDWPNPKANDQICIERLAQVNFSGSNFKETGYIINFPLKPIARCEEKSNCCKSHSNDFKKFETSNWEGLARFEFSDWKGFLLVTDQNKPLISDRHNPSRIHRLRGPVGPTKLIFIPDQ